MATRQFAVCVAVASAVGLLSACPNEPLREIAASLRFERTQVDFGTVALGSSRSVDVVLHNDSRVNADVTWRVDGEHDAAQVITVVEPPAQVTPGPTTVHLVFAPSQPIEVNAVLLVQSGDAVLARVLLHGQGVRVECQTGRACHESVFDPVSGTCNDRLVANGTPCGSVERDCVERGQCADGECRGSVPTCDDGDVCTADSCAPGLGCLHAALRCPNSGPCLVGECRPTVGCVLNPVEDGTSCGPTRTCTVADVCISGACVERDPPDGFVCAEQTPCQGRGVCVGEVCQQDAVQPLAPAWDFDGSLEDGGPGDAWSDVMLAPNDEVTLSSYFVTSPRLAANEATSVSLKSNARRCIVWSTRLVCADLPSEGVSAIDLATGQTAWAYTSVTQDVSQLGQSGIQTFLARVTVLSPDRVGVLFEARTLSNDGSDTNCRRFAFVVLNAQGALQGALFLEDPIFEVCRHPHSFGVATDATGTLFVAFTFSSQGNPATPDLNAQSTTIFALGPDAQVKWKRVIAGLPGGELAVGSGVLVPERGREVLSTRTGETVALRATPFGMGVIGEETLVGSPQGNEVVATSLEGTPLWSFKADAPWALVNNQLHAARWATSAGTKDVLLSVMAQTLGLRESVSVAAIDAQTGRLAFRCEANDVSLVSTFEVGERGMVVMSQSQPLGADLCTTCDPRFAQTRNRFQWLPLPTVTKGRARWNGPYGDASHSHHEASGR